MRPIATLPQLGIQSSTGHGADVFETLTGQMALHPECPSACLFFVLKARPFFLPFTMMTVLLAFVVDAVDTDSGLGIREIHEWPATSPEEARRVLVDTCGWPANTTFAQHAAFT